MALGRIKSMYNQMARKTTPNKGILIDVETGTEYTFSRPAFTTKDHAWNVKVHDYVTYTASGTGAVDVTLYKKHSDGLVISVLD